MLKRRTTRRLRDLACRLMLIGPVCLASGPFTASANTDHVQVDLKDEHDPARRCDRALALADSAFDSARASYTKEDIHKGNAQLDDMTAALNECISSLESVHKSKLYKKAEMRVSFLQRRMQTLMDEISVDQRGWAEQIQRKLEEIHDKLLEGAMKK